jgi:hypothetical protein
MGGLVVTLCTGLVTMFRTGVGLRAADVGLRKATAGFRAAELGLRMTDFAAFVGRFLAEFLFMVRHYSIHF